MKKVAGQDSEIELNGVKYTGDSNSYSINGLTIEALAETGDSAISITTSTDTQGVYDKVKGFSDRVQQHHQRDDEAIQC